jgi:ribonucleoside-diphosphate reductase beta chain
VHLVDTPSIAAKIGATAGVGPRKEELMTVTLDQLALQGDPGTLKSDDQASKLKLMTPQQLYELWERQHWLSQEIDFSQDRRDWAAMEIAEKDQFMFGLSAFFVGEERVTTQFSGLVMAYADEQEECFLATQQVDEARHVQFFDRLYQEVFMVTDPDISKRLERVRRDLNSHFIKLFDEVLVEAGQALIADPSNIEAKVDFVTTYHMVIEGVLALTGQKFITDFCEREGIMPGFVEGFGKVARDEHRHVAYGTWFLKETAGKDERLAERMRARIMELLPVAAGVLVPVGYKLGEEWELFGYDSAQVNEFAYQSLTRRLKAIGVPLVPQEPVAA